jgi:hypothetical protein
MASRNEAGGVGQMAARHDGDDERLDDASLAVGAEKTEHWIRGIIKK